MSFAHEVVFANSSSCPSALRTYPLGFRISGKNMSPLPFWLAGAQSIALNFSPIDGKVDWAVQLHFALFNGSEGYVLKPPEMRTSRQEQATEGSQVRGSCETSASRSESALSCAMSDRAGEEGGAADEGSWPPPRERLHLTTMEVFSAHNIPKVSRTP
jgi:hypothetical protein